MRHCMLEPRKSFCRIFYAAKEFHHELNWRYHGRRNLCSHRSGTSEFIVGRKQIANGHHEVKQHVLTRSACQESMSAMGGSCVPGALVEIKKKSATGAISPFISRINPPTRFDQIALRAECNASGDGIVLRYAWLRKGATLTATADADFLPHPVLKLKTKWSDQGSLLFPAGVDICGGSGLPVSPTMHSAHGLGVSGCLTTSSGGLCDSIPFLDVTFPAPFGAPPHVLVSAELVSNQGGCVGFATDQVSCWPENITASGFRLRCGGSPVSGTCSGLDGLSTYGRAGYIAIGR